MASYEYLIGLPVLLFNIIVPLATLILASLVLVRVRRIEQILSGNKKEDGEGRF